MASIPSRPQQPAGASPPRTLSTLIATIPMTSRRSLRLAALLTEHLEAWDEAELSISACAPSKRTSTKPGVIERIDRSLPSLRPARQAEAGTRPILPSFPPYIRGTARPRKAISNNSAKRTASKPDAEPRGNASIHHDQSCEQRNPSAQLRSPCPLTDLRAALRCCRQGGRHVGQDSLHRARDADAERRPDSPRAQRRAALALTTKRRWEKLTAAGQRGNRGSAASACDYYAENGGRRLADEVIVTDASRSFVTHRPLGVILAVMPWNFPFWQVFRFAAPTLMAGNVGVLKHAANVPGCARAIEDVFRDAGFPANTFRTLIHRPCPAACVPS